jgi:hypothetical protein
MVEMLSQNGWQLTLNNPEFNDLGLTGQLDGLMVGFLMGIVPGSASLDVGYYENSYGGANAQFPDNLYRFDYTKRQIRIPVKGPGDLKFIFGTNIATANFPRSGVYTIQFSDDWNTVLSINGNPVNPSPSFQENHWDDGYPSGGNYWSDYTGLDEKSGISQDLLENDGIGDTTYAININNQDRYPLMQPYNGSHDIGIRDVHMSRTIIALGYNITVTIDMAIINCDEKTEILNFTLHTNTTTYKQTLTLLGGNSMPITFTWDTKGLEKGYYTINAYLEPVLGETDIFNNNFTAKVYIGIPGDVDGNGWVEAKDISSVAFAYGSHPGDTKGYNPNLDVDGNDFIDVKDILATALNYGKTDSETSSFNGDLAA